MVTPDDRELNDWAIGGVASVVTSNLMEMDSVATLPVWVDQVAVSAIETDKSTKVQDDDPLE